jgi:hypothetical protein
MEIVDAPVAMTLSKSGGVAGGGKGEAIIKQLEEVGDAIADVCNTLQGQIQKALDKSKPKELELEFSLTLAGEAGVPLVTKGTAEGTFKVTAKWEFQ